MSPLAEQNARFRTQVLSPLEGLARRVKRCVLVDGLCVCSALFVVWAAAHVSLDRLLNLGVGPRALLLLLLLGFAGHQLWRRLVRPIGIRVGAAEVAAILERRDPALRDRVVSSVAFASAAAVNPQRNSPELVAALIGQSSERFQAARASEILDGPRHRRRLALGASAAVAVGFTLVANAELVAIYVARDLLLQDVPWPSNVHVTLEGFPGGRMRLPLGDDLTLVATAQDEVPPGLAAEFRTAAGGTSRREMDRRGRDQFVLDYGPLTESLRVRLHIRRFGADEQTDWYDVEAIHRPAVRQVDIRVAPPEYAGQPPYSFPTGQTGGDVLRGSSVRIAATMSKPLVSAALHTAAGRVADAAIEDETRVSTEFSPDRTGTYYFDVTDHEGLADTRPVTFPLRVYNDPPPRARLAAPGVGEMVVPDAVLDLDVDCEDDLGLKTVELLHVTNPEEHGAASQPAPTAHALSGFVPRQTRYQRTHAFALAPLTVQPGDRITLQVRAVDYQPNAEDEPLTPEPPAVPTGATGVGRSTAFTFRVVTREELLADLGRREQEWRREFEQIIKSQEQINSRVMDLRDQVSSGRLSTEAEAMYNQESRSQRRQAGRMNLVRRQFAQILAEMKTNQIATPAIRRRLDDGVLKPLAALIDTDVPAAADQIERLRRRFDPQVADEVERGQTRIVQVMYGVLTNMLKWEGYNEAVSLLQDIVRLQDDVNRQTQARLEREIERLFGPEPTTQPEDRP